MKKPNNTNKSGNCAQFLTMIITEDRAKEGKKMVRNRKNPKKPVKAGNRAPPRTIIISEDAKMKGKISERRETWEHL